MNGKGDTQRPKRITDAEWDARYAGTFCTDYRALPDEVVRLTPAESWALRSYGIIDPRSMVARPDASNYSREG